MNFVGIVHQTIVSRKQTSCKGSEIRIEYYGPSSRICHPSFRVIWENLTRARLGVQWLSRIFTRVVCVVFLRRGRRGVSMTTEKGLCLPTLSLRAEQCALRSLVVAIIDTARAFVFEAGICRGVR